MPEFAAGARVDRPDVIGKREVQDAVDSSGVAWMEPPKVAAAEVDPVDPGQAQEPMFESLIFDERAEAPAGVVAVVSRPRIGGRLSELRRVKALRKQR